MIFNCEKCIYSGSPCGDDTFMCYAEPQPIERYISTMCCRFYKEAEHEAQEA